MKQIINGPVKNFFPLLTVVMDDEDGRCLLDVIW